MIALPIEATAFGNLKIQIHAEEENIFGIPANLQGILKTEDIQFLADSAYADACRPGNPRDTSVEEIIELYQSKL